MLLVGIIISLEHQKIIIANNNTKAYNINLYLEGVMKFNALKVVLLIVTLLSLNSVFGYSKKYYGFHLCDKAEFSCQKYQKGHTWQTLYPNEFHREMIKKLNRANVPLHHRPYHVRPNNIHSTRFFDLSPLPRSTNIYNEKHIIVDLSQQAFAAYDAKGNKLRWGPISGGKNYCPDIGRSCRTIIGDFRVYRKGGPGCKSIKYDNAPMPYCMFFHKGFAMHGAKLPGHHASHGCVRMFNDDAYWLNKNFVDIGTRVIIRKGFD